MNKLKVKLENCYGIKKLEEEFDFSNGNTICIYAPNGCMKTSFAKTFSDFSQEKESEDKMYPDLETKRLILDEAGIEPNCDSIFVINSYDEEFTSERISTLVANKSLRKKHEAIMSDINKLKEIFLESIRKEVKVRLDIESELLNVFEKENFISVVKEIKKILEQKIDYDFSKVSYDVIFSDKSIAFIESEDFKTQLKEYIELYDSLLENSRFLKNGLNHYKANKISAELKKDKFFEAKHQLKLFNSQDNTTVEVASLKEFQDLLTEEKNKILTDENLQTKFQKIDTKIKNKDLEDLRDYLKENQYLLNELKDIYLFQKKVWISHIKKKKDLLDELSSKIISAEKELESILKEAKKEQKLWGEVIEEFNRRFFVPFQIRIGNQEELILEDDSTPVFEYVFNDGRTPQNTTKEDLMSILSEGEKRALYLLNIIFEIKGRQKENTQTLFLIDDIADSFDYKNKYAIIEYIKEISNNINFKMIVLTHNFDFYRTISSRLCTNRKCNFHVIKTNSKVELIEEVYQNNPFKTWKNNLKSNRSFDTLTAKKHIVGLIPFVRNIIEFGIDKEVNDNPNISKDFIFLTNLLHYKDETQNIKIENLKKIYKEYLGRDDFDSSLNDSDKIYDLILDLARNHITNLDNKLENKLILAIAIRLKAEEYMKNEISDTNFLTELESKKNQTRELYDKYVLENPTELNIIKRLDSVNIMTPENIHLNSFMYEPILDMNCDSLIELFNEVSNLNQFKIQNNNPEV